MPHPWNAVANAHDQREKNVESKKKREKQRHKRLLSDFLKIFDFTESTMESIAKAEIGSVKQMITTKFDDIVTKDETNGDDIDRYNNFIASLYKNRSELNELIDNVDLVQTLILNGISSTSSKRQRSLARIGKSKCESTFVSP